MEHKRAYDFLLRKCRMEEFKRLETHIKNVGPLKLTVSNKDFISNAPGHIVVADEQKLRELKIKLDKIQEQLKSFS